MGLTKVSYSMIEGAPINVLDFGAVGDGTTDDFLAFQSAVAALPNGGTIYIPPGTYVTNSFFEFICDNISFVGSGISTVLKSLDTTTNSTGTGNHCTLFVTGDNCSISNLKIDGNKAAVDVSVTRRDGVKIEGNNGVIENVTTIDTVSAGVFVYNGDNLSVKNCTVLDAGKDVATNNSFGVFCASTTNVLISGNYVKTTLQSGIFSYDSTYVTISNNVVTDAENGIRISPLAPANDAYSTITGNVISDSSGDLIRFTGNYVTVSGNVCTGSTNGSGANSEGGTCQTITGNTFANNIQNGIRIGGTVASSRKLCISGNTCYGNTGNGIYLVGGTGVSITDALISGNMLAGNTDMGIRTAAASVASTAWIGTNNTLDWTKVVFNFTNWTYHNNTTRGQNITAASTIYVGDANLYAVAGTADITTISGGIDNQEITLRFTANAASSGIIEGSNIRLTTANFVYTSASILKLVNFDGTWFEVSRAVN